MSSADETLATRDSTEPNAYLSRTYGWQVPVVYFIQRRPDGPIKIGHAHHLQARYTAFYNACPDPVITRALVPGGQSLEHWFHRRHAERRLFNEWYEDADTIAADAKAISRHHATAYREVGDLKAAVRTAVRTADPLIADVEKLYRNGLSIIGIAKMAGISRGDASTLFRHMRQFGFEVGPRRAPAIRGSGQRFERHAPELGERRFIG